MSAEFIAAIRAALLPLSDPVRAIGMAAYMKNQFPFLGVPTPVRRLAVKGLIRAFRGDALDAAALLWRQPEREFQYVACDLLRTKEATLSAADLPALESLVVDKSWWDSVDSLAPCIGLLVLRERELVARMDALIRADNFWLRRVALLYQLGWKEQTDRVRLFGYCLACAPQSEFFIRKAIGWALRQYARTEPKAVRDFLRLNGAVLSPLSVREAGKHL